jgi:SH3-like domain-containing protein
MRFPMSRCTLFTILTLALTAILSGSSLGQTAKTKPADPIRFASLRANEVNVRAGPGVRYPVKWVFVRKKLPVAITAEFESWRKIRDSEDAEGWVHRAMLSAKRSVVITGQARTLRRSASNKAPAVAQLSPGIVGQIDHCTGTWCEVAVGAYSGWVRQAGLWGLRNKEVIE